jgi:hypothetical protein
VEPLEERALLDVGMGQALNPSGSARFVTGLYYDLLHRQPVQDEVAGWAATLDSGTPRAQIVADFVTSSEYRNDLIRTAYQTYLGRDPESGAVGNWMASMQAGLTYQAVLANILASPEYFQDRGGSSTGFLTGLYHDLFNRSPDSAGLGSWNQKILGHMTRDSVAISFVFSTEEFRQQVQAVYKDILGRQADAGGTAHWVAALKQGMTLDQVTEHIAASPEYVAQQAGVVLPVKSAASAVDSGDGTSGSATGLVLQVAEFTTSKTPVVTFDVGHNSSFAGRAWVNVDLQHDGSFADAGDDFQTTGILTPQAESLTLNALPAGTYQMQGWVRDVSGKEIASPVVSVMIDPNGGFVGSQTLKNLVTDYSDAIGVSGALPESFFAPKVHPLTFDDQQRVEVNVHAMLPKYLKSVETALQNMGMIVKVVTPGQNMVTGFLPIPRITDLPNLANFEAVTPVYAAVQRTGSAETQGDAVIKADIDRQSQGVNGTGIKVGVLSDTVNQVGSGIAGSQATGDLPAAGVQVLEDGNANGATDEGRAMLEIVNDVAPGASLAFHTAALGPQDFANGIQSLADAGAKVIVDDVGYLDSPFFNDGVIAQKVNQVVSQGVFYASAAGNDGSQGFTSPWTSTQAQVGTEQGTFLDLGGGNPLQRFTLTPGHGFTLDFQWDNAFLEGGSTQPNFRVSSEVDVLITTADGSTILKRLNDNTLNTNEALQLGDFTNNGSFGTDSFALAFELKQGAAPTMIRWLASGDDPHAQGEGGPTIYGQPAAKGAVAVAAVPWSSPTTAEPFTSNGGSMPFLFDAQGNRLAKPEYRIKPEIAAPDGVDTSFFGSAAPSDDADQHRRFFGTSAAAPHVAGAAALLLQQDAAATPEVLLDHFLHSALHLAAALPDGLTGAGLIQVTPIAAPPDGGGGGGGAGALSQVLLDLGQTSDQATDLGTLAPGGHTYSGLGLMQRPNGLPAYNWARWTMGQSGTLTVSINYQSSGDLHLRVYTLDGQGTLAQLGSSRARGTNTQSVAIPVGKDEPILVWVYGFNHAVGNYTMEVDLN